MGLELEQHPRRDMMLVLGSQETEQMGVATPFSDIDWPFPTGVLQCAKREHVDEPLDNINRGAPMCRMV